jgi:ABC-type spermidine/putrescine transport system permease subunit II
MAEINIQKSKIVSEILVMQLKSLTPYLLLLPTLTLSGLFFVGPLIQSLITSFTDKNGAFSLENYQYFFNSRGYLNDLWFTLAIGLATVITCTLISLPLALLLRRNFWGKSILWVLALAPLVTPHIIAAYALRLTLSPTSPLLFWLPNGVSLVNAWTGLVIALTWKFFPVMLLALTAALQGLPPNYEEAARDLGGGFWRRLYSVLLPLIAPGWLAGATLVFVLAGSQFTITLIMYGGQKLTTIPLDVYFETFTSRNPGLASALGLVLMLITLVLVGISTLWVRRRTTKWATKGQGISGLGARTEAVKFASSPLSKLFSFLTLVLMGIFVFAPLLCLILYSVSEQWLGGTPLPSRFTLSWYDYLFRYENGLGALGQSLLIALTTTLLVIIVAIPAAYALARYRFWGRGFLESLFLAKTATPVIVIGVGTATLFYAWRLTDTFWGIVLAHSVGALPLAVRSATASFERIDRSQEEAARDLGARTLRRFISIVLPAATGGIIGGSVLAFLYSMDEFTVTFLISGVNYSTLPLRLYSALNQGYIEPAAAAAVILLIPSLLYLVLLIKLIGTDRLAGEVSAG